MISILGVIVAVTVSLVADDPGAARNAKLESDISTLNQMVALYVADGGNLGGLTTPQQVIDKLKKIRPHTDWKKHTGMASGRLVDVRLMARPTTRPDSDNNPRVVWDRAMQRFQLTTSSGTAVSEFYLDETLAGSNPGTEKRTNPFVSFNTDKKGWVWSPTATNTQPNYLNPRPYDPLADSGGFNPEEEQPPSGEPPTPDPGGDGGGPGGDGENPTLPTLSKLPRPVITPGGGTFAFAAFPASATISSNGALPAVSRLMYRVNGGAWTEYTGATLSLSPAMTLQAKNESTRPAEYADSSVNTQTYYRLTSGFSGTGDGTWGNAIGGTNLVTNIQNDGPDDSATFKHGNTKLDLGNGEYLDAGVENVLTFTPEDFDTVVPNVWFTLGELMMLNGTTFYNSEATGVTLSVNMTLTQPAINLTTHIDLGFTSTENTSDRLASADAVQLKNPTTDVNIIIDGVEYRLELSWETLDPGAGVVQGNNFLIFEGATAQARLRARFTSNH
ncbi:MAG: choice-of-anchor K domain-containing protein [Prosthecobacter sp.]